MNLPRSPRLSADLIHCVTCLFHQRFAGKVHLCTLPPHCAPMITSRGEERSLDHADGGTEYLGTECDVMRRQDAACGPAGTLWRPIPSHAAEARP